MQLMLAAIETSERNPMLRRHFLASALALSALALSGTASAAPATPLQLSVYNPGAQSMFPVSSTLIAGRREAILIDAQFQRNDAEALVRLIRAGGKTLTTVYISHSDPDYYFGLDVIQAAFPQARIVATAPTVAAIEATMAGKLAYWGPILKDNAPGRLVLPEVLAGDRLDLEGRHIEIKGLRGPDPKRSHLWIPSLKTVVGGVVVSSGIHVWTADTQTPESRRAWQATLQDIAALKPARVVPGHFLGAAPAGLAAVEFTAGYLRTFETAAAKAANSAELVEAMRQAYPALGESTSLSLSAKVAKGEMKWPQ